MSDVFDPEEGLRKDLWTTVASRVWGVAPEEVTTDQRYKVKKRGLVFLYSGGNVDLDTLTINVGSILYGLTFGEEQQAIGNALQKNLGRSERKETVGL